MVFLAAPYAQMDGTLFASANCGPSVCTELISLASVDALRISAPTIRRASGDTVGGIEGRDLATTVNKLTNYLYPFLYRSYDDWGDVRALLEHASVGIIIDCGKTVNTKYRTNSFTGNHWITIAGGSIKDGTVKYEDPGTTAAGWQRIPLQLLRAASDFGGRHWVLVSPGTEDVQKHATTRIGVFAKADRESPRLGTLDKGKEVHVAKTTKGGPWRRDDGTKGHGWHVVDFKGGKGFVVGRGLR